MLNVARQPHELGLEVGAARTNSHGLPYTTAETLQDMKLYEKFGDDKHCYLMVVACKRSVAPQNNNRWHDFGVLKRQQLFPNRNSRFAAVRLGLPPSVGMSACLLLNFWTEAVKVAILAT